MRQYVTRAQLLELLNAELAKYPECEDCRFDGPIWRLQDPLPDGRNWSDSMHLRCSGRSSEACAANAQRVASAALGEYGLRSDEGWLDDLTFNYQGHLFQCVSESRGVSMADDPEPSTAFWYVVTDGGPEKRAFEAGPNDTDAKILRQRIIDWYCSGPL